MATDRIAIFVILQMLLSATVSAHPGSGIVVDKLEPVYFTETGMGVWKIEANRSLSKLPACEFHWMAIDTPGPFADSQDSVGNNFERVTTITAS